MLEKWERQPGRVGMVIGFLAVPLLWWLRDTLFQLAFGLLPGSLLRFQLLHFFAAGAIPGAVLGSGISNAISALQNGNRPAAKSALIICGAGVALIDLFFIAPDIRTTLQNASLTVNLFGHDLPPQIAVFVGAIFISFPLHCALLTLFIGLLMRARS